VGTYDDVVTLKLVGFRLETLRAEPLAIDKSTIRAFDVFDVNLRSHAHAGQCNDKDQTRKHRRTLLESSQTSACCLLRTLESK
jgi:hypothetical protein